LETSDRDILSLSNNKYLTQKCSRIVGSWGQIRLGVLRVLTSCGWVRRGEGNMGEKGLSSSLQEQTSFTAILQENLDKSIPEQSVLPAMSSDLQ